MAAFQKFNSFTDVLAKGGVKLDTDVLKVLLTNTAPVATMSKLSDIASTELANGNGYATGGAVLPGTGATNTTGTETIGASAVTFTSNTGNMGPFRYLVVYDSTANNQPLIGFYDYGSSITLNGAAGETFVATPGAGILTIA